MQLFQQHVNAQSLIIDSINLTPSETQTLNLSTDWIRSLASLPLTLGVSPCLGPLVLFLAIALAFRLIRQNAHGFHGFFNPQHPAIFTANLQTTPGHHASPAA